MILNLSDIICRGVGTDSLHEDRPLYLVARLPLADQVVVGEVKEHRGVELLVFGQHVSTACVPALDTETC